MYQFLSSWQGTNCKFKYKVNDRADEKLKDNHSLYMRWEDCNQITVNGY
jgi:hypothetical protein